MYSTLAKSGIF